MTINKLEQAQVKLKVASHTTTVVVKTKAVVTVGALGMVVTESGGLPPYPLR